MAEQSAISWTDATFNPWWGCYPVSPGCALCYAEREAKRYGYDKHWEQEGPRRTFGEAHWNEPLKWARKLPEKLGRRPRVFCASMADIGDAHSVCAEERPKLWKVIEQTPRLDWLLLTKRVDTAREWLPASWLAPGGWPAHAWFGFSAERQKEFDERWPFVREIPAAIRFCSYEPALGPVDFSRALWGAPSEIPGWALNDGVPLQPWLRRELRWIIAGGESGPKARPSHPEWYRSARDQAVAAGVAFHFKQWGEWQCSRIDHPGGVQEQLRGFAEGKKVDFVGLRGGDGVLARHRAHLQFVGKRAAGRVLDGRTWDEFPTI